MDKLLSGTIAWFRATSGRGMIDEDGGHRYFFDGAEAADLDVEAGLRVEFAVRHVDGGATEAFRLRYQGGRRTVHAGATGRPEGEARRKTSAGGGGGARTSGRGASRRTAGRTGGTSPPAAAKAPPAMREGTMVSHPEHGPGHVVAATRHLVSVEFLSGERKTYRPDVRRDIGGPVAPGAPRRRGRRATMNDNTSSGRRVVRRRKGEKR